MLQAEIYVKIEKSETSKDNLGNAFESDSLYIELYPISFEEEETWDSISKEGRIVFYDKQFIYKGNELYIELDGEQRKFKFSRGDRVEVVCSYRDQGEYTFKGYLDSFSIKDKENIIIMNIKDEFFLFNNSNYENNKSVKFNKSFKNLSLNDLVAELVNKVNSTHSTNIKQKVWDLNDIITFNIEKDITAGEILRLLMDRYEGIRIFFRRDNNDDTVLYVGWPYWFEYDADYSKEFKYMYPYREEDRDSYNLILEYDIIFNTFSKDDILVKVTSTSKKEKKKLVGQYPKTLSEEDALEVKIINFNDGNFSQKELDNCAESTWKDIGIKNFSSAFVVLGLPSLRHGDKMIIDIVFNNTKIKDRYVIKKINRAFSDKGFQQKVECLGLERKFS